MSEDAKEKRRQTYLNKYGGEAGYRAEMSRRSKLSALNPNRQKGKHRGGFNTMTHEQLQELGRETARKRWGADDKERTT